MKCEGKIEVLKKIALELRKIGVEEINLVGGDPAEYSKIEDLTKYLYKLGFRVPILSNTHQYKNSSIEKITPYVTSLEATFHAPTCVEHDRFNNSPGSYEMIMNNLKKYKALKTPSQNIGAVLNIMNHNYNQLYEIIEKVLEQGLPLDYVLIQRIGLYGRAQNDQEFAVFKDKLVVAFEQIDKINNLLGVESVMVDAFPLYLLPEEYHKYLDKCDWGYGTASIDMNGDITRCAVAEHSEENFLGNVLKTPIKEIWETSPTLLKFRNKSYLRNECQNCNLLEKCGGGCPISCGTNHLSTDILVKNLTRK